MSNLWRTLEFLSLGTWVGSIIFLSFAVAPGAFSTLGSRDQAGALVGMALGRLHLIGIVAGGVFLVARAARTRSLASLWSPAALAVIAMVIVTVVSQYAVSPRMVALRQQMGSVDATPLENPLRIRFDQLHRISVRLEVAVLLLGLGAMFLTARRGT